MHIFCDGASRGNPGKASLGVVAFLNAAPSLKEFLSDEGVATFSISQALGVKTNNEAEYLALIAALEECAKRKVVNPTIYSDSELIIKQMRGEYKVKDAKMRELFVRAQNLVTKVAPKFLNVPREKNQIADLLANRALDG